MTKGDVAKVYDSKGSMIHRGEVSVAEWPRFVIGGKEFYIPNATIICCFDGTWLVQL